MLVSRRRTILGKSFCWLGYFTEGNFQGELISWSFSCQLNRIPSAIGYCLPTLKWGWIFLEGPLSLLFINGFHILSAWSLALTQTNHYWLSVCIIQHNLETQETGLSSSVSPCKYQDLESTRKVSAWLVLEFSQQWRSQSLLRWGECSSLVLNFPYNYNFFS